MEKEEQRCIFTVKDAFHKECKEKGRQHPDLLEREPHKHGIEFCEAILDLLLNNAEEKNATLKGNALNYIESRTNREPSSVLKEIKADFKNLLPSEGYNVEKIIWLGLAVLAATACGIAIKNRGQSTQSATQNALPKTEKSGASIKTAPPKQPVCFAVASFSGKLSKESCSPEKAGDLFFRATFWWAGSPTDWDKISHSAQLKPLAGGSFPDSDSILLISAYQIQQSIVPTSRLEIPQLLQEAATKGTLKHLGIFNIGAVVNPVELGFRG